MIQTLLLNADYNPHEVISWQRAMTLWAQNKVEIVETYPEEVRSVSFTFKMPSVVRLFRYIKSKRRSQVQFTRANIYTRDNYTCQYCREKCATDDLTFDHVVPVSRGGPRTWENITTACLDCNRKKGNRTPEEAGMTLASKPVRPKYSPIYRVTIGLRKTPESWRDFLYWSIELENDNASTTTNH